MKKLFNKVGAVIKSEDGQGMVEYGLIVGLISVAVLATLLLFGPQLITIFSRIAASLTTAAAAA